MIELEGATLDRTVIEQLVVTCGDGGEAVVASLVETACTELRRLVTVLRHALADGDAGEVRRAAHTLKSHGMTFGSPLLVGVARDVELAARAEDLVDAGARAWNLEIECRRAREALTALRHELLDGTRPRPVAAVAMGAR